MNEIESLGVKCWSVEEDGHKFLLVKVNSEDDLIIPEKLVEDFKKYVLKFNG